ncbi:hypothetical protein HHK36_019325 [Tetracentron sinense]|uniref:Scaffold protein Nfu/NifU N-terminal domain-containing protein n=1 Tax=Tetracentron sinense TaxID=13715 RepID=A0A834YTN0_TETSI|nr:hypothetical protein HHK36_019325 [Tetracentron sinense]
MNSFGRLITRVLRKKLEPCREYNTFCISRRLLFDSSITSSSRNQNIFAPLNSLNASPVSSFNSRKWSLLGGQKRSMFIQTQSTPNPSSLMFYPGKPVMEVGSTDFPNARSAMNSPLAKAIYGVDGVARVFYGSDFITVTKSEDASWDFLKPEIFAVIMDFYSSGNPLFLDSNAAASMDTAIHEAFF